MQRTPIPNIQKLILAAKNNSHLLKLSLANLALTDTAAEVSGGIGKHVTVNQPWVDVTRIKVQIQIRSRADLTNQRAALSA